MSEFAGKHVLIIIEDNTVPFDTRMWQEAKALKEFGADVSIICPKTKGRVKTYEQLEGIEIYRHTLKVNDEGALGFIVEYVLALFWQSLLALKIYSKQPFDVIHGCSPPDLIYLTAFPYKLLGVKYIFDHHDVSPELYFMKYNRKDILYKGLKWMEKLTFKTADYSIATNKSYKEIAVKRGGMEPDKAQIVRSGPDLSRMKIVDGNSKYKNGKKYLAGYIGNIGKQEGLDILMESVKILKDQDVDVQFAIMGSGGYLAEVKKIASDLDVDNMVRFYGRVSDDTMREVLNTCDLCVNPDKPGTMNDISTMNKIMEYMALGKPIVQFDMKEGRRSAKESSLYAKPSAVSFADKIETLVNDDKLRKEMGEYGYDRVQEDLKWDKQKEKLHNLYTRILN